MKRPKLPLDIVRLAMTEHPKNPECGGPRDVKIKLLNECYGLPSRFAFALRGTPPRGYAELRVPSTRFDMSKVSLGQCEESAHNFRLFVEKGMTEKRRRVSNAATVFAFAQVARDHIAKMPPSA